MVEKGMTGYAFKHGNRFDDPYDKVLTSAYDEQRIFKVVNENSEIVGITIWKILHENNTLYFGPFAVRVDMQGKGIAKIMLSEIYRIAKEHNIYEIEIYVVNHRDDLFPWYERLGYKYDGVVEWDKSQEHVLTRPAFFRRMTYSLRDTVIESDSNEA
jgi:GNAT superfamily N-acetyltransferase